MRKWTTTAGLLFCAAASVYSSQAIAGKSEKLASTSDPATGTDVTVLEEPVIPAAEPAAVDPFATTTSTPAPTGADTTSTPSTQPADIVISPQSTAPPAPLQMNSDGTFSLNIVSGADLVEQLRVIGFQAQMSIIPSKEVRGSLPAIDLYDVTATEALDALLHSNGYAWRQKGNFVYVYSLKEVQEMEKANRHVNSEVFRLYYTPAADAVNMIKPVMSADGQAAFMKPAQVGLDSGSSDTGGNSHSTEDVIVVTDYPENLDRIREVLKEVDRRPQQILIEATILRATLTEENRLGVDFNVVGGVDFNGLIANNSGQFERAQIPPAGSDTFPFEKPAHSVGTGTNFTDDINGFKVGVLTNNVSVFVAALEDVTDTAILANPKVLALNKQQGEVLVGREDGYLTTTITESQSTQTVEFLQTGTRLIFRPFIGDDGYIRMEIHPEDSSGSVSAQGLPSKVTTEVTSNVMVKDGHTIVIGGLFRESSSSAQSQVPFVGSIPIVGNLFKNQRDLTTREEVIILLTPHIVKDQSVYAQLSEEQLKDAERLRVGIRRGMMPWGRERMADLYYQSALRALDKDEPDRKKAIFFLDAATHLNPGFIEAINLKEELTGREVTTADGTSVRTFVKRSIMVDLPSAEPMDDLDTEPEAGVPTTQPMVEVPTTQPLALNGEPTTQPLATEESTELWPVADGSDDEIFPLCETDMEQPGEDPMVVEIDDTELMGTVPSSQPSFVEVTDPTMPPSSQPSFVETDFELLTPPSSQPSFAETETGGATTQPSEVAELPGLNSLKDLFKTSGEEESGEQDDTTVTELPMEPLDGGSPDNK